MSSLLRLAEKLIDITSDRRLPLRILDRGARGRGVVAAADIAAGELVERSPVLIIPERRSGRGDATIVFTYVFMWEHDTTEEDLYGTEGRAAIALGYTSLLNHSYDAELRSSSATSTSSASTSWQRDIAAGEELTIDYQMTLWFTPE